MPPHHHHHHGHHHGRGFGGPPLGALLVGGMVGASIGGRRHHHPPPERYYRGRRYRQVIIVHQVPQGMAPLGPNEILVSVTCPIGARPGDPLEIEVDGQVFAVVIPNVREAEPFYARVSRQPVVVQRAPIVSTVTQFSQQVHQAQPVRQHHHQQQQQQQQVSGSNNNLPTAQVVNSSESSNFPEAKAQVVDSLPPVSPPTTAAETTSTHISFSSENPFLDEEEPDWVIAPLKEEFDQFFVACGATQKNNKTVLSPVQVRNALLPTGLAKELLRNIWELSDIDKDGSLDSDEFAVAMYLCREAQAGRSIPSPLPPNVVPPSKRNPF